MKNKEYRLRKWARFIKVRDKAKCALCDVTPGTGRTQSHHIKPKALFPNIALQLENGVCLCTKCHKGIVHKELINDRGHWEKFVNLFQELNQQHREWNQKNQHRI